RRAAHDRRLDEGDPCGAQLVGSAHCGGSVRPSALWIASHTRAGVTGMSMWRTPNGSSASTTAFTRAGGEPTLADSPTPLAPRGWCGDGVHVSPSSQSGHSIELGTR